jgi:hypothetical protein
MAESKAQWEKVGEEFRVLGRQVKQHYDQRPRPGQPGPEQQGAEQQGHGQPEGDQAASGADQPAPSADRRKVDDTLQKLTESLDQAFSALGDAIRDPQFGEQARKAANSLSDALNATFAEASERFRKK